MSIPDVEASISKYEAFVNNVLKEDLRSLEIKLQHINAEISDLIQQKHTLAIATNPEKHPDGFKSQINLGCNFFMEARVRDTSSMLINIGLNIYLEFSREEAIKYLKARITAYESKAEELKNKSVETKAHIKLVLLGIGELQNTTCGKKS